MRILLSQEVEAGGRAAAGMGFFWCDQIVLIAVKSQHTQQVLAELAVSAPASTPIVCLQNGIANEPVALRLFANVYGVSVACPASYCNPRGAGVVYPGDRAARRRSVSSRDGRHVREGRAGLRVCDVRRASHSRPLRWKHRKLLTNLGNAVDAVCGPQARRGRLGELLLIESDAVLRAAGLEAATAEEDETRRGDLLRLDRINGSARPGGSTWQSLKRHTGDVETDYLNCKIVLLGRIHAVPTPANELMQQLARECATGDRMPCSLSESQVLDRLGYTS